MLKRILSRLLRLSALIWVTSVHAQGLTPLSDSELSATDARQGVLLNLSLLNNMTRDGMGVLQRDSQCSEAIRPNPCRMGLEIAQRDTWLMLKEFYGSLQIKDLRMDAGFLPAPATGYQNYSRFRDAAGNCLLSGNPANCNPAGLAAIQASYPSTKTSPPSVYDDVLSFMNIGRTWLEYSCGPSGTGNTLCATATEGYMRDTPATPTPSNSVFGVRLSDSRALNEPAHMRFRGTAYVFGF